MGDKTPMAQAAQETIDSTTTIPTSYTHDFFSMIEGNPNLRT